MAFNTKNILVENWKGLISLFICTLIIGCSTQINDIVKPSNPNDSRLFEITNSEIITYDLAKSVVSKIEKKEYKRIAILNSPFYAYFRNFSSVNIAGVFNTNRISKVPSKVQSLGEGDEIDLEKLIACQPDLIICNSYQADAIKSFDTPKLIVDNYLESEPKRRKSFFKLAGAVTGKGKEGIQAAEKESNLPYQCPALNKSVVKMDNFGGEWFQPGCDTYISKVVKLAGAEFNCFKNSSKSEKISHEQTIVGLAQAEYLIFMDWEYSKKGFEKRLKPILRLEEHPKKILYCNTQSTHYFEHSLVNSGLIIEDLHAVLKGTKTNGYFFELINLE